MALVFKFTVGVDHNFVRFHGRALDPSYLIVGFVQVIDTIEKTLSITFLQANVSTLKIKSQVRLNQYKGAFMMVLTSSVPALI